LCGLEELQQLRAELAQLRRDNERLRRQNERLQRDLDQARADLDQARRQAKRQAAPFSKGPPKPQPRRPGRKAGSAHGHRLPPGPRRSIKSSRLPCPRLALTVAAPWWKRRSSPSIRPRSQDAPSSASSTSTSALAPAAAGASRGGTRCRPP